MLHDIPIRFNCVWVIWTMKHYIALHCSHSTTVPSVMVSPASLCHRRIPFFSLRKRLISDDKSLNRFCGMFSSFSPTFNLSKTRSQFRLFREFLTSAFFSSLKNKFSRPLHSSHRDSVATVRAESVSIPSISEKYRTTGFAFPLQLHFHLQLRVV